MSDRRFKVSKPDESNHYRYSDLKGDDRATEKLLPSNDEISIHPSANGKSMKAFIKYVNEKAIIHCRSGAHCIGG